MTRFGFQPGGFAQVARCQPLLREPPLRCAEKAGDHLRRYSELCCHLLSRMRSLAAQPEIQTNDFLLLRPQSPQQTGDTIEIQRFASFWEFAVYRSRVPEFRGILTSP